MTGAVFKLEVGSEEGRIAFLAPDFSYADSRKSAFSNAALSLCAAIDYGS